MKTFVTLFPDAQNVHLVKDVGQIPYLMHRLFGYDASVLVYPSNAEYPHLNDSVKGLKISWVKKGIDLRWFNTGVVKYLIRHAGKIDVLNLYHETLASKLYAWLYKRVNPNGFVYVKLDGSAEGLRQADRQRAQRGAIRSSLLRQVERRFARDVDCISIETREAYAIYGAQYPDLKDKLVHIPNGIDDEFVGAGAGPRSFDGKENLIITVGRLGSAEKNTQMLIDAVTMLAPLNGWKLCLIGERTAEFDQWLAGRTAQFPHLAEAVVLVGQVSSRNELYAWYDRAKIFVLSSRHEGFPLVFPEALFFGNVIITTDVSGAADITDGGRIGKITPIDDAAALADALRTAMADASYLKQTSNAAVAYSREHYVWSRILLTLQNAISRSHV